MDSQVDLDSSNQSWYEYGRLRNSFLVDTHRQAVKEEELHMKDMLALLGAALVVFAGLGWYLGWYHVGSTTDSQGNRHIELDLNAKKIGTDISNAGQTIGNKLSQNNGNQPTNDPHVVPASGTTDSQNKGFGSISINSDGVQIKPNIPNLPFSQKN